MQFKEKDVSNQSDIKINREVLTLVDVLAREKNVDQEVVFWALEEALAMATKRLHKENIEARVQIHRTTGEYTTYRRWLVVPDAQGLEFPDHEILLFEAQEDVPSIDEGDWIEEEIDSIPLGRIGAQTAKQIILQRVREAERQQILNEYLETNDQIFIGVVRKVDRRGYIIDSGKVDGFLPREKNIPKENVRIGDRLKAYIESVETEVKGPQIQLSRISSEFLMKLFNNEVPEVEQGVIEIIAAARDPGVRSKVAVRSLDPRVDPIGTLVGVRGTRIMAVRNQLCNEAVDIIIWSDDPAQFVMNALAPAQVKSIIMDEERQSMEVVVDEDDLAIAIGRGGQNVRLASELTGWGIDVVSSEESMQRQQQELEKTRASFRHHLGIEDDAIQQLLDAQVVSLEEVAYIPVDDMIAMGFEADFVNQIRQKARDALLNLELAQEEEIEDSIAHLRDLDHMDDDILAKLALHHIHTMDDLAELSTDELMEITEVTEDHARRMIIQARKHWFDDTSATGTDASPSSPT